MGCARQDPFTVEIGCRETVSRVLITAGKSYAVGEGGAGLVVVLKVIFFCGIGMCFPVYGRNNLGAVYFISPGFPSGILGSADAGSGNPILHLTTHILQHL